MEYLLDTNICIYIIKKKPRQVFDKLLTLDVGSVGISTITLAELYYGVEKSANPAKNKEALEKFLTPIEILDFGASATETYGKIRAELERNGNPIGPLDMFIAAHAKSADLTLVTNNEKEFIRVVDLKIENGQNENTCSCFT
ncbi:MAG: type II toxin-antitoxin system VapC family toxin [Bacteroidetes bacterium]|nr:type II toxin-antitoxin system VapC family toxin [Bacteroidota bacterium]